MHSFDDVFILVPVYDEESVIGDVIADLKGVFNNIVAVDDGSTDKSYEILKMSEISILRHPINIGVGAAITTGFQYILNLGKAKAIVTFDGDGQHTVNDAKTFAKEILRTESEVIFGSRFIEKNNQIPYIRKNILRLGAYLTNKFTGLELTDTHNGMIAVKTEPLKKVNLDFNLDLNSILIKCNRVSSIL